MKVHPMNLFPNPFNMIKNHQKTIELRLYDEKRRQIKAGDIIQFIHTENGEILTVKVLHLYVFQSFNELYKNLPLEKCGYTPETIHAAHPSDMNRYYSLENQQKYGAVGIEIQLLSSTI